MKVPLATEAPNAKGISSLVVLIFYRPSKMMEHSCFDIGSIAYLPDSIYWLRRLPVPTAIASEGWNQVS